MIGVPFDNNDLTCLGSITEIVADLVDSRDPAPGLVALAAKYKTTEALAAWIRSLPQRNDEGLPGEDPKVAACRPPQRLRIPADDPNCVERAALYLGVAELLDPWPVRQLGTLDFDWGRHTFPIENGAPIVLDPRVTYEELEQAIPIEARTAAQRDRMPQPQRSPPFIPEARTAPVAVDVNEAIDFTCQLAQAAASSTRNGPSRAYVARNAIENVVKRGIAPSDLSTVDALGWFFSLAEQVAHGHGARALKIVRITAVAISDLIDDILAERELEPRNLSLSFGGNSYSVPSWVSEAAPVVGKIGLGVGALYFAPQLAALGITGPMVDLVEQELNAEGLTLGSISNPKYGFSTALSSIASKRRPA
ncbi:MAG: hypothetical protein ABIY55_20385 [Kofleriaceae bacterium]